MNDITTAFCCVKFKPYRQEVLLIRYVANKTVFHAVCVRETERERAREPLLSAATQCVTELFKFIEKVPPFSATILWKDSRECDGGTLTKSMHVKGNYVAL